MRWGELEEHLNEKLADAARAIAAHRSNRSNLCKREIASPLVEIYSMLDRLRSELEIPHPAGDL